MKKNITILLLVLGLLFLGLLFFFNRKEDVKNTITMNSERVIRQLLQENNEIKFDFTPSYMAIKDSTLTVLNYDKQMVFYLNERGEKYDSLGDGRGDSPKESNRMYHYDYDDSNFYFFDVSNSTISKINKNTNTLEAYYKDTIRIEHSHRIIDDDFIFLYKDYKTNISFSKINIKTKEYQSLSGITKSFPNIENSWWIYDGKFDNDEETKDIIYLTYYSDDLLKINQKGELIFKVGLIHETPLIKLTTNEDMLFPSENTYESALDTAVGKDYYYVLSNVSDRSNPENRGKRVIDSYDKTDGEYSHSYILPNLADDNTPSEIEVNETHFFILYENSIQKFKI